MTDATTTIPNPLCEIGRTHPRDRHRMRPVEGEDATWFCPKHEIYAVVVDDEVADSVVRGAEFTMANGTEGTVLRHGDERGGGRILYVRPRQA